MVRVEAVEVPAFGLRALTALRMKIRVGIAEAVGDSASERTFIQNELKKLKQSNTGAKR